MQICVIIYYQFIQELCRDYIDEQVNIKSCLSGINDRVINFVCWQVYFDQLAVLGSRHSGLANIFEKLWFIELIGYSSPY